jgi:hypothetical protein
MVVGRFGVPVGMVGMIDASATVRPSTPWTDPQASDEPRRTVWRAGVVVGPKSRWRTFAEVAAYEDS